MWHNSCSFVTGVPESMKEFFKSVSKCVLSQVLLLFWAFVTLAGTLLLIYQFEMTVFVVW